MLYGNHIRGNKLRINYLSGRLKESGGHFRASEYYWDDFSVGVRDRCGVGG